MNTPAMLIQNALKSTALEIIEKFFLMTKMRNFFHSSPNIRSSINYGGNSFFQSFAIIAQIVLFITFPDIAQAQNLLKSDNYKHYVQKFNTMEQEFHPKAITNAQSWDWMIKNIPFFECSSPKIEETYYYRWWTYRKHITKQDGYLGFVMTEFITFKSANSSAYCHQLAEGRWMHDKTFLDDYTNFWFRAGGNLHKYSQWSTDALYKRYLVTGDKKFVVDLLDKLVDDYKGWEKSHKLSSGLFWSYDVRDAMEESISGSRTEQNIRPTKNSYMAGNAQGLVQIARLAGRTDVAEKYQSIYDSLRKKIIDELWDPKAKFFKVQFPSGSLSDAREAIGFIPWMFGLPGPEHEDAWLQIRDPQGFLAPKGLTTAEQRHPKFRAKSKGPTFTCEWDGPVWPFATSQTLNALSSLLRNPGSHPVNKSDYYNALSTYANAHQRNGIPHIGEYHDEKTGVWLRVDLNAKEDTQKRGWYYNHSTFCDLVINGLVGLVPRDDDTVEVDPLVPEDSLSYFALDKVLYHGTMLSILWDRDGSRYGRGAGLKVYAENRLIAMSPTLKRVSGNINGAVGIKSSRLQKSHGEVNSLTFTTYSSLLNKHDSPSTMYNMRGQRITIESENMPNGIVITRDVK